MAQRIYEALENAPITNITSGAVLLARHAHDNPENMPYAHDPLYIIPDTYVLRNAHGHERFAPSIEDCTADEIVVSAQWVSGKDGCVLSAPYDQIEYIATTNKS